MAKVMVLNNVRDTKLWKRLETGFKSKKELQPLVTKLLSSVEELCEEGATRMKRMPALQPEFTLHDETHLLRVTELMGKVLGKSLNQLNPMELALLILAAHFHDQGMVVEADRLSDMKESPEYKVHCDTWAINHPNLHEIEQQLQSQTISTDERKKMGLKLAEMQNAMIADYVRRKHGRVSAEFVRSLYGSDKRLEFAGVNLADIVGRLCESHVLSNEDIKKFHCDELVGTYPVNVRYLAVVLRVSDILDFDRDRTPDILFRTIHFSNDISIQEWEKHRGVQGWVIRSDLIRFDMEFEHPVYERTARCFIDSIDTELVSAAEVMRSIPAEFAKTYKLDLPQRVDRSRIGPKNKRYIYYDLEFSLSWDEVVKLLMGDKLYSSPSLCVRELLQNSLDALRYRSALYKTAKLDWKEGQVEFEHKLDEDGYQVLGCCDNGVGMDELIITRFLSNVGRSFYRSAYFELERARFREAGVDFDPCSQFGIGFMSCFMLGDRIRIETRRDYGPGRQLGKPLIVEVNGLGGMLVVRSGKTEQPVGTRITITLREKQIFVEQWSDKVKLTSVLGGYALATEFPIKAMCYVPGIEEEITITTDIVCKPTIIEMEDGKVKKFATFEVPFRNIDKRLGGLLRESFLVDEKGIPTVENDEARWNVPQGKERWANYVVKKVGYQATRWPRGNEGQVCLDGILVCGEPGKYKREKVMVQYANIISSSSAFILDVRGDLKPEITPARTPPHRSNLWLQNPRWERLQNVVNQAEGQMWEEIAKFIRKGLAEREFWKLGLVYDTWFVYMKSKAIWDYVGFPIVDAGGTTYWRKLADLERVSFKAIEKGFDLITEDGSRLTPGVELTGNLAEEPKRDFVFRMKSLSILMGTLRIRDKLVCLEFNPPINESIAPSAFMLGRGPFFGGYVLPYDKETEELVTIECAINSVNRKHPLVQLVLNNKFIERKDDLQNFARAAVLFFADSDSLKRLSAGTAKPTRWMKTIGWRYLAVEWARCDEKLHPPYQIWLKGKGRVEITEKDFERWAKT